MAYRDFNFDRLKKDFGIIFTYQKLFHNITPVEPSNRLLEDIELTTDMLLNTEKLVSEALVFPILQDIRAKNRQKIRLFSGEILTADKKRGLNGECDFIMTNDASVPTLHSAIFSITEAKKGDIEDASSLGQTIAQMIGAKIFNQKDGGNEIIYGACTDGKQWLFMKLEGDTVLINTERFGTQNLPQLLGVLQQIVDFY